MKTFSNQQMRELTQAAHRSIEEAFKEMGHTYDLDTKQLLLEDETDSRRLWIDFRTEKARRGSVRSSYGLNGKFRVYVGGFGHTRDKMFRSQKDGTIKAAELTQYVLDQIQLRAAKVAINNSLRAKRDNNESIHEELCEKHGIFKYGRPGFKFASNGFSLNPTGLTADQADKLLGMLVEMGVCDLKNS